MSLQASTVAPVERDAHHLHTPSKRNATQPNGLLRLLATASQDPGARTQSSMRTTTQKANSVSITIWPTKGLIGP